MLLAFMLYAFAFGFICWLLQLMVSIFARTFVSFYGDETDRQHVAETKSTIEALAVMFRIIRAPSASSTASDPEVVAVERQTALILAQTRLREAQLALARLDGPLAHSPSEQSDTRRGGQANEAALLPQLTSVTDQPEATESGSDSGASLQVAETQLHDALQPDLGMEGLEPPAIKEGVPS